MSKCVFYSDNDFVLEYEILSDTALVHCIVNVWKISVLKKLYVVVANFADFMEYNGINRVATVTPNPKFAQLFNGRIVESLQVNGQEFKGIIWDLK